MGRRLINSELDQCCPQHTISTAIDATGNAYVTGDMEDNSIMRTTIVLDDALFTDVTRLTGAKNKSEAVRRALSEFVRLKRKEQLLALRGQLDVAEDWQSLRDLERNETVDA